MSKSDTFENDLLKLIFNGTAIAGLADNAASAALGTLYVSLHTADPGEASTQSTSEVTYTGYARVGVARGTGGWTVTGNSASPANPISFPAGTGGGGVAMFFAVGTQASGAGKILYSGVLGAAQGPFTAAVNDTFTVPGHTMAVDDRVAFFAVPGSQLPGGITEGTVYFVKTAAADVITIAATQGGATIDVTTAGDGVGFKNAGITLGSGVTPQLSTATAITED